MDLNKGETIASFHHGEAKVGAPNCCKLLCRRLVFLYMLVIGAFLLLGIRSFVVGEVSGVTDSSSPITDPLPVTGVDDIVTPNRNTVHPRQSPAPTSLQSKPNIAQASSIPDAAQSSKKLPSVTTLTCGGEVFGCITDRIGHNQTLFRGEAVCSRKGRYVFGINDDGILLWRDCTTDKTKEYYQGRDGNFLSFVMERDANFVIHDEDGNIVWEKRCKEIVPFTSMCLHRPAFDCPYLHLHKGGVMVLNFIDPVNGWVSRNFKKLYDF